MHRHTTATAKFRGRPANLAWQSAASIVFIASFLHAGATRAAEAQPRSLFVMNRDGSGVRNVSQIEGYQSLGSPRWSHDGKRLVFDACNVDSAANRCFAVAADGSGLADVAPGALADWSPDDKQLAFAGGQNASLKKGIWVQNTSGQGRQWLATGTAPHWSPDGGQIAHVADTLMILDLAQGTNRAVFEPTERITNIRFGFDWSPDGERLAVVVERDGAREVVIVNAAGAKQGMRTRLKAPAHDVAWSRDGKTLAVSIYAEAMREHRIHLLSADGEDLPVEIPGQKGDNREPAWSPDDSVLALTSSRRDVALNSAVALSSKAALEKVTAFDSGGTCYSLAIAPDNRTALLGANLGNKQMQVWDMQTGEVLRRIGMVGVFVAVAPNGKEAACWQLRKPSVTYFKLEDGSTIHELETDAMVIFIGISGDGSRLVCGTRAGVAFVFDLNTGTEVTRIKHDSPVGNGALSPDGSMVATSADNKLYLWETATGKKLHEGNHPAMVWGVAFSPDGALVATGTGGSPIGDLTDHRYPVGDDNSIRLWDTTNGKVVRELKGHTHAVTTIAFSPDGRRLASGSLDGSLRLWDVESGQELDRASGRSWIMKLAYSSDGMQILTSGGNFRETPETRRLTDVPDERVRAYRIVLPHDKSELKAKAKEELR
jgi:WD40 repeat protein